MGEEILKQDRKLENLKGREAKEREEEIRSEFGELQVSLKVREELIIEEYHEKISRAEKEVHVEKDGLEFVVCGLQGAISFGEVLLREGSKVEIGMGSSQFIERIDNLMALAISKRLEGQEQEGEEVGGPSQVLPRFNGINKQRLEDVIGMFGKIE